MKKDLVLKIKGEFLKFEDEGERHHIQFVDENGKIDGVRINNRFLYPEFNDAIIQLEQLEKKILAATDEAIIEQLKNKLVVYQFKVLLPEMYKAHCRGESLDKFFTESDGTIASKRLKLERGERDKLNAKIVIEINKMTLKVSQEKAFRLLSEKSKKALGQELTPKQIEGRYKRNELRFADLK